MYETNLPPLNWNTILSLTLILLCTITITLWAAYELQGGGINSSDSHHDAASDEYAPPPSTATFRRQVRVSQPGPRHSGGGGGTKDNQSSNVKVAQVSEFELLPITSPFHHHARSGVSVTQPTSMRPNLSVNEKLGVESIGGLGPSRPRLLTMPSSTAMKKQQVGKWKGKKGFDQERDELLLGNLHGLGSD